MDKPFPTWLILLIAAINGLIYVFFVPPWEHNDEPGNFEYAWLFANMEGKREEWMWKSDQQMRREVAASMIEHGFFEHHPVGKPNLILLEQEIWIGLKQTSGLPLYFWLASLPLRFLKNMDIVLQLHAARLVSWLLFCFTVYISILVNRELDWEQKWGSSLPLLFALFPSFVDKMTAVNDDVAAVAFFTLFLFLSIRIWSRGITLLRVLGLFASVGLCLFTKRNVWISLPLSVLLLSLVLLRRWKPFQYSLAGLMLILTPFTLFSVADRTPAYFYAFANQQLTKAVQAEQVVIGERVAQLLPGYRLMYQPIAADKLSSLKGRSARVGVWVWGKGHLSSSPLRVLVNGENLFPEGGVILTDRPVLIQHTLQLPKKVDKVAVEVSLVVPEDGKLYLDCLFLVVDPGPVSASPVPKDAACSGMQFGNTLRENFVKNGSFERTWFRFRPWLERWVDEKFSFSITHLWAAFDPDVGLPYLRSAAKHVFETFWGRFGWGSVPLRGANPYVFFVFFAVLLGVGNFLSLLPSKGRIAWDLVLFLLGAAVVILVMTLFRNGGNWIWYEATPNARYLMPAFLPLGLFILNGWGQLVELGLRFCKRCSVSGNWLWFGWLIGYNVWALLSIWSYYVEIRS
ncbi:MAG: hypothetical protein RML93_08715 [Anaerolineales bacterium]|nr:hypothetical protein [Anaerolineales bacterium]MCS7248493.1 hypothetical protein [Anaerolineales bacterium]MDW8162306.1 hypothetical protein [Anaerolineales bacterium]MDW8447357.1 hypothetical protein [Anaerolineales bacterium]